MWPKTLAGLVLGLLLSISLVLNLNLLLPFAVDVRLFAGLLLAFALWSGGMVYVYHCRSWWRATWTSGVVLLVSGTLNAVLMP